MSIEHIATQVDLTEQQLRVANLAGRVISIASMEHASSFPRVGLMASSIDIALLHLGRLLGSKSDEKFSDKINEVVHGNIIGDVESLLVVLTHSELLHKDSSGILVPDDELLTFQALQIYRGHNLDDSVPDGVMELISDRFIPHYKRQLKQNIDLQRQSQNNRGQGLGLAHQFGNHALDAAFWVEDFLEEAS